MSVLEIKGLRKRYGKIEALAGVDLSVAKGEVFGFLGPNGAGKTTFTKCVTGFVRPTAGEVSIMGIDAVEHPPEVAHHIGLVPDQYDFYPNLTGRQHLDFYGRLQGLDAEARSARIEEVLGVVRMHERADSKTKTYSHGMKQRICIAQAILHHPDIVFFDEPTNGLDPKGAYELREMIRGLSQDGTTVFLNSHILHEVEQVCERVAILYKGHVKALSPVRDLRKAAGAGALTRVRVRLDKPLKKFETAVKKAGASGERLDGDLLVYSIEEDHIPDSVAALVKAGARITGVQPDSTSLEAVFLELTQDAEGPQ